jgi:hypothetical protein
MINELDSGWMVDHTDTFDRTPFWNAINRAIDVESVEVIKLMLNNSANPKALIDKVMPYDQTSLCRFGYYPILDVESNVQLLELLLSYSKNKLNYQDRYGITILHYAIKTPPILRHLLTYKEISICLRKVDRNSHSPLNYAVLHNNWEAIELLIQCDPTLLDEKGLFMMTAFDRAVYEFDGTPFVKLHSKTLATLHALYGLDYTIMLPQYYIYRNECMKHVENSKPTQKEVLEIRYRVYFSKSLVSKLLFIID